VYFLLTPVYSIRVASTEDLLRLALFAFTSVLIGYLTGARKRAEKASRESAERFRVTLSSVGDAVIVADGQGRVMFMNRMAESLTGWTFDEAARKPLGEVF
jgi:PAS domain-containing protein